MLGLIIFIDDKHKDYIKLSDKTRRTVEDILSKIKEKLERLNEYCRIR